MEKKTIAILGYGQRGRIYADYALNHPDEFEVVSIIDTDEKKRELAKSRHTCNVYADYKDFLNDGVKADIVAVSTQDASHVEHAIKCMEKGYDLLLEKPIATNVEDCIKIYDASVKYGRKVIVCHVLRYTPFYCAIKKIIESGKLGKIITINASENVGYYHQAHSFVRGPWRNSEESCPMIVAKCCHDLDILRWLIGEKCEEVYSVGALTHFTSQNAPEGSADYCTDCNVKDCEYRAQKLYSEYKWMRGYFSTDAWNDELSNKLLIHSQYDRCVYKCDNNVVDHQSTVFKFANDITVTHTMTAFSKEIYRDIKIHGTKAELYGLMEHNLLEIRTYGKDTEVYDFSKENTLGNHGGGDNGLMHALFLERNGIKTAGMTYLDVSLDSHLMAFGAEKSRLTHETVKLNVK